MQPEMTPHEIANEIGVRQIQSRIYGEGETFVMVEGKTDEVLWEEFRSRENCTIYPAKGKDRIIAALAVSKQRKMSGVAGIVDADYWLITEADELGTENLLYDGCCPDAESILLDSDALRKVLRHSIHADDTEKLHSFADKLKSEAQRLAMEFGYFRLFNHLNDDYDLRCNAIRFADVIDCATLELDRVLVASKLSGEKPGLTGEELLQEVDELKETYSPDDARLCRGKDAVAIMAHILPALFKLEFGQELCEVSSSRFHDSMLAKDLRMAYEFGYFMDTSLFSCIRNWESKNTPYRIIREIPFERTP